MKIAVEILHYNSAHLLPKVLKAVSMQSYKVGAIVIVDNGSSIKNQKLATALCNDHVEILIQTNKGAGAGHNAGWKYIIEKYAPEFIWVLEHDVIPEPDCLQKLLEAFERDRNTGIPVLAALALEDSRLGFGEFNFYVLANWRPKKLTDNAISEDYYGGLSFNGLLLPVDTIKQIGYLNESYFIGYEDIDFYRRIERTGGKVLKVNGALVHHNLYKNRKQIRIGKNISVEQ